MKTDTQTEVALPDAPQIAGLHFRTVDLDADLDELVRVITVAHLADGIDWLPTTGMLRNDLEHRSNFDLARDMLAAEIDGTLVALTETNVEIRDAVAVHEMNGWVTPDHRRRGIGRALLHWVEARARESAATWTGAAPHALGTWIDEGNAGALALLESGGYERVRYGFMMLRPLDEPIPDAPLPDGLEIRPVVEGDHRRIWDADCEAFRDHWAATERTEEDYLAWFLTPNLDTSLWRVAWDGDEIAGSVWNAIWAEENEKLGVRRGWLEHVSVRRPWRRRGLATALIAESLRMLRDQDLAEAALGVDAENVSGALRIYESVGFRRHRMEISYRKPL